MIRTLVAALALAFLLAPAAYAGDAAAGKAKYDMLCFTCHGATGVGDGPAGAALNPPPRDFTKGDFVLDADGNGTPGEDADLVLVIKNGAGAYGGNPVMAPWGAAMTDDDVNNVVAYVRSLKK